MVERREEEDLEKSIVYPKPEDLADLIKEILDTQQKDNDKNSSSPLPGERTENIDGLIINAEIDFKASYSLYKDRIYSSAVYHLQQAIEKLIKACAIISIALTFLIEFSFVYGLSIVSLSILAICSRSFMSRYPYPILSHFSRNSSFM